MLLLLSTVAVFWPAVHGPFVFDDFPNLQNLRELEGTLDAPHVRRYLAAFNGNPGRPLAALSFIIEDSAWPTDPEPYKRNNIFWHLLAGVLVFALTRQLAGMSERSSPFAENIALATTAMWLLHPMQLSATMLVVQRMAILSSVLMLAGLLAYLSILRTHRLGETKRVIFAASALGLFGLLAMLCKENGVLIFAYATAINLTLLRPFVLGMRVVPRRLLLIGTALPIVALAALAAYFHATIADSYVGRDFTLVERLLTQPRVLLDYLHSILLPRIGGQGVFHDDFAVSRSLLEPASTLVALLLLLALAITAWAGRKRVPIYAFAVFWFLAGHLIESTIIPLELYFEHRNYLPMLGPLFLFASIVASIRTPYRRVAWIVFSGWLALAAALTAYNATIWGDRGKLAGVWLAENPKSIRAIQMMASYQLDIGRPELAGKTLDDGYAALPSHPELRFQRVLLECVSSGVPESRWSELEMLANKSGGVRTIVDVLEILGREARSGRCHGTMPADQPRQLMQAVLDNPAFSDASRSVLHYELARQAFASRDLNQLMHHLDLAYAFRPSPLIAREQAIYLLMAGLPEDAMHYLEISEHTPYPRLKLWLLDMPTFNAPLWESARKMQEQDL